MARVSIYLNFQGNAEEAFNYYKTVFGTEFTAPMMKMKDMPPNPNMPALSEKEADCVMHVSLPITGGTLIMGSDMLESLGHMVKVGNNTTISLELDSQEECDRLYGALSVGSTENAPMRQEFWGYWGCCLDRFGIRWMFNKWNQM